MSVMRFIAGLAIAFVSYSLGYNRGWVEAIEKISKMMRKRND